MNDTCVACGRYIYTTVYRGPVVTLMQQWTHGSRRIDRQHAPIPTRHEYKVIGGRR